MPRPPLRLISLMCAALVALSACNFPGSTAATPQSQDAIFTAAALTMVVQLTQNAPTPAPTATSAPPSTESIVAETPPPQGGESTESGPAATEAPAATSTPSTPKITASQNTNCRSGPSMVYPIVGILGAGQSSDVQGRDSKQDWWYIANPGKSGQSCWVWTETTQVEGDASGLPVITPPPPPPTITPTPTPGASVSVDFDEIHDCSGALTAIFEIDNSGGDLESARVIIVDEDDDDDELSDTSSDAPFMGSGGECPPGGDTLKAGKTGFVGGAVGSGSSGHDAQATILLCTKEDLDGNCIEKSVDFEIP